MNISKAWSFRKGAKYVVSVTESIALEGVKGRKVIIQTDIAHGLPFFTVIGLGDTAVKEASERVRRAIINSGFT